jgi:tetratricopeptide (TPR) repeat protein
MLFDLRGRGRRNVIKVVYIMLAFLMGGGLVFFGIGGNTSGGGLVDAFTDGGTETDEGDYDKQIAEARAKLEADPNNEAAYGDLIRAQVSRASTGEKIDLNTGEYTEEGKADLRAAVESWEAFQKIDPKNKEEEASIASRMVEAYTGLGDIQGLVAVQEVVVVNRESVGTYAALAQYAYLAGQTRKGDLAAKKALELEDPEQRAALKSELDSYKTHAPAPSPEAVQTVTASPEADADDAKPKGKKGKKGKEK